MIFAVPAMLAPVDVNTALAVVLPATKTETLALAVSVMFELPFCTIGTLAAVAKIKVFALITFAPVILPPVPEPVVIFPAERFPEIFAVPVIFAPVPVTTKTFALPATLRLMLPFAAGIFKFELPFETFDTDVMIPVN